MQTYGYCDCDGMTSDAARKTWGQLAVGRNVRRNGAVTLVLIEETILTERG